MLEKWLQFVKGHHTLLIVLLSALLLFHFGEKGLDAWERHDQKQLDALQAQVASDKTQVAEAQQQVAEIKAAAAQDKAASAQIIAAVTAQNAALNKAIADRDKTTAGQQQVDLHATLPVLGQRLVALVPGVNPQDIQVAPDQKTVIVGVDTAQKTVAQLELVPGLQADLKDTQQQVTNLNSEIKSLQTYNSALEHEVAADDKTIALLQKELADADKACDARVGLEKDKTKKAFMHGLKIGGILGFFAGLFGGHAVGL